MTLTKSKNAPVDITSSIPSQYRWSSSGGSQEAADETFEEHCGPCGDPYSQPECDELGSVKFKVSLGRSQFGDQHLNLRVHEKTWSDRLYSRESIRFVAPENIEHGYSDLPHRKATSSKKRFQTKGLAWVKTDTMFTRLDDISNGYTIRQYTLDQVSGSETTGEPFKTIRITNPDPDGNESMKRLLYEKEQDGRKSVSEYRYRKEEEGKREVWELYRGKPETYLTEPLKLQRLVVDEMDEQHYSKTWSRFHWRNGQLHADSVVEEVYRRFPFGDRKISRTVDPDGQRLTIRLTYYGEEAGGFPVTGRVKSIRWADGDWDYYTYMSDGRDAKIYTPVGNTPLPETEPSIGKGYRCVAYDYDRDGYQERRREIVDGVVTSVRYRQWNAREIGIDHEITEILAATPESAMDDPRNRMTRKVYANGSSQLRRVDKPDGSHRLYEISESDEIRREIRRYVSPAGNEVTEYFKELHVSGAILEDKRVDSASGVVTRHLVVDQDAGLDSRFRPVVLLDQVSGDITRRSYACCGLDAELKGDGMVTRYEYDVLGRKVRRTTGYAAELDSPGSLQFTATDVLYERNSHDRIMQTRDLNNDGRSSTTAYNLAAQRTETTTSSGVATQYKTVFLEEGGRLELTSLPRSGQDNRHRITSKEYTADGKLLRTRTYASKDPFATKPDPGTTVSHTYHEEGIDERGRYEQTANIANIFDQRITRTYLDQQGRQKEIIHAYGTKLAASETFDYNKDGQLIRHINPDGVTTRYAYNEKGERTTTALDLDIQPNEPADHIDYQVDRITVTSTDLVAQSEAGVPPAPGTSTDFVAQSEAGVPPAPGTSTDFVAQSEAGVPPAPGTADVPVGPLRRTTTQIHTDAGLYTTSISIQSLDGTYSATTQNGDSATRRKIDSPIAGTWQIINTQPNGAHAIQSYENGRLIKTTRHDADGKPISWTSQTYDHQGRPYQVTDSRTGTTTHFYNDKGQLRMISAPNPKTASSTKGTLDTIFEYDALGQRTTTTKPSGGQVHQVYNANGTLRKTHGHHTTDVEYRYNGIGERTHMITFYGKDAKESRTIWRNNARGQLAYKQDAAGKRVRYTYTPGGKLKTRTWARGVKTTYHYSKKNRSELAHIDYSDATPDVHFTYTRLGQKHTVQDAGGLLTYAYRETNPLELESETRSTAQSETGVSPVPNAKRTTRRGGQSTRAAIRQNQSNLLAAGEHLYSEPKPSPTSKATTANPQASALAPPRTLIKTTKSATPMTASVVLPPSIPWAIISNTATCPTAPWTGSNPPPPCSSKRPPTTTNQAVIPSPVSPITSASAWTNSFPATLTNTAPTANVSTEPARSSTSPTASPTTLTPAASPPPSETTPMPNPISIITTRSETD